MYEVFAQLLRRDLAELGVAGSDIRSGAFLRLRGSLAAPHLWGLDRVVTRLLSMRGRDEPTVDDVRHAAWTLSSVSVRSWLPKEIKVLWADGAPHEPEVVSGLRAHAYGLPAWSLPPQWWMALDGGNGPMAVLSARRVSMILGGSELLALGVSPQKPASAFVHLARLSPYYDHGGFRAWFRAALDSLSWIRHYEEAIRFVQGDDADTESILMERIADKVYQRWS